MELNTIQKGNITEIQAQLLLVEKGYHVFTPITDGSPVDLIYINNGYSIRVQIKRARPTATGFRFETRKSTGSLRVGKKSYTHKEIDAFGTVYKNKLYIVPLKDVCKAETTLRVTNKYLSKSNRNLFAKEYEI